MSWFEVDLQMLLIWFLKFSLSSIFTTKSLTYNNALISLWSMFSKTYYEFIEDYRFKFTWIHNHVIIFWANGSISMISECLLDYLLF